MAQFITRVELHGVNHDHTAYTTLHEAMQAIGFMRTIVGDDGITYHLPTAEYNILGSYTIQQILDASQLAADKTGYKYSIFVSLINQATWVNLSRV